MHFISISLNRGRRPIRVLIEHQRGGYTEADTKREAFAVSGPPGIAMVIIISLGFVLESQTSGVFLVRQHLATVKIRAWRVYMHKTIISHTLQGCWSERTINMLNNRNCLSKHAIKPMCFQHCGAKTQ